MVRVVRFFRTVIMIMIVTMINTIPTMDEITMAVVVFLDDDSAVVCAMEGCDGITAVVGTIVFKVVVSFNVNGDKFGVIVGVVSA